MVSSMIVFSPTGGTFTIANIVAQALGAGVDPERVLDLCNRNADPERIALAPEDACVVAVPSYGGRVPTIAAERLAHVSGNGARAILVCAYGNRAYEDTLVELQDLLDAAGFRCVAAIAAIAEHSIVRTVAAGRPTADDRAELTALVGRIKATLETSPELEGVSYELELPGNRPYKPYGVLPMVPVVSQSCIQCGQCARSCPVAAIPAENPCTTDPDRCISCMRCANVCPVDARALDPEKLAGLSQKLSTVAGEPKRNELFLARTARRNPHDA